MQIEAEASVDKESRITASNISNSRIGPKRVALEVMANGHVMLVGGETCEAGSTSIQLVAASHVAKVGDFIQITSGDLLYQTVGVHAVDTDNIHLSQPLTADPAVGVTFDILKPILPRVSEEGASALPVGAATETTLSGIFGAVQFLLGRIVQTIARPPYASSTGHIRAITDTTSNIGTVNTVSTVTGVTTVTSVTNLNSVDALAATLVPLQKSAWALNVRAIIT